VKQDGKDKLSLLRGRSVAEVKLCTLSFGRPFQRKSLEHVPAHSVLAAGEQTACVNIYDVTHSWPMQFLSIYLRFEQTSER